MSEIWMDVDAALAEVPVNKVALIDDTDFKTREESVVYNQAGMDLVWNFVTTAGAYTQTAVTPTTAGVHDWTSQGNGMYSLEVPASAGTINNDTEGFGWFTGFATGILPWTGPIIGFRAAGINNLLIDAASSATRGLAGTALPNAVADAAGGLAISDLGGLPLDRLDAAITSRLAPTVAARTLDVAATGEAGLDLDNTVGTLAAAQFAAAFMTAAKFAAGAIDAAALSTDAVDEIVAAVWDRVLTGGTHNIANSSGRRLRLLQESGNIYGGRVHIDTVDGVAGTTTYDNGTSDNAVDLLASAKTLAAAVGGGLHDFHIINGSTILLAESTVNESYFGDNWILQLGSQDVAGAYFQGAAVSGIGTSTSEVHYEGCDVATMSVQLGHFDFCSFDATVTMTLAGDYNYHNCYSKVAGVGGPTFTKTAGQAITAQWRNWAGTITLSGIQAGDVCTISGTELGDIVLNGADGTVKILGIYESLTDNRTGAPTLIEGAYEGSDVTDILANIADIPTVSEFNRRTGYAQNSIWIDTVNGAAGTTDDIHGVESNPVNSIADANTLSASLGINRFVVAPGSSITFAAAQAGQCFVGDGWTLALGGQNVANIIVRGAVVSGVMAGTGVLQKFYDCVINPMSAIKGTLWIDCNIAAGTITVVEAGEFLFKHCASSVAGASAPIFDFGAALNSSNLSVRDHSGGWEVANMGAGTGTYNASFEGDGQIIWAASCSATSNASIRGNWRITDNAGGAVTETLDDNQASVDAILLDTADIQPKLGTPAADLAADIAAIKAETALIVADTNELQLDDIPGLIAALNDISTAETLTQINAALDTAIAELGVAAPTATPTLRTGLMLLYMAFLNQRDTIATADEVHNAAAAVIATATVSDDGVLFRKTNFA